MNEVDDAAACNYGQDTEGTWSCPACEADMYLLVASRDQLFRCTNPDCGLELYESNLVSEWSRLHKQAQEQMAQWQAEQDAYYNHSRWDGYPEDYDPAG